MKRFQLFLIITLCLPFISQAQLLKDIQKNVPSSLNKSSSNGSPSNDEVISGLKEALNIGISKGADIVSQKDGYFGNSLIKILMPPDAKKVEDKLRSVGMGDKVDQAILSMNRAAEAAGQKAKPIFVDAIKNMSVSDAFGILKGPNDAATQYLKKTTSAQLTDAFKPVIKQALDDVGATKYWKEVFDAYNKIPFVKPVTSDLPSYVTQKALDGLFYQIAQEEAKIRLDPVAQVTDLLKKVFGSVVH